jgi:hypothetical protein
MPDRKEFTAIRSSIIISVRRSFPVRCSIALYVGRPMIRVVEGSETG